jgi:hypothetical protein
MKIHKIAIGAAMLVAGTAFADVEVNITGASAFRVATLDSIKAQFDASGEPYVFAHDRNLGNGQSFNGGTRVIFRGTFPGVSGVTTIRTSFNGSVQGLDALVNANNPTYLEDSVLTGEVAAIGGNNGGLGKGSTSSPASAMTSHIAFSDVATAATPYAAATLQPTTPEAGVVIFTMIANNGAPANLTNVNTQNFRALFSAGLQPLSLFTGSDADAGIFVFASGRNDGSGTRTTYLAESGYGIANTVQQYVRGAISGDEITQIHRVPAAGSDPAIPGSSASNASTQWGNNADGNGGYSSGSALRDDMGRKTTATQVLDADGSELAGAGDIELYLVTWLSAGDAAPAWAAGGKILGYNGEILEGLRDTGAVTAADEEKITRGSYTAWSYQQMYRLASLTSDTQDEVKVYNGIKNNLVLGTTGIPVSDMHVGRIVDGGVVSP